MQLTAYARRSTGKGELNQMFRIMKLLSVFLFAIGLQVSARGYTQNVTLSEKNATLEKIFSEIRKQTGFEFLYTTQLLSEAKKITINVKAVSVEEALKQCLKGQPLDYVIRERTIVITAKTDSPNADGGSEQLQPPIDVKGKIVNEKNEPVSASIVVKGTNKGTSTNDNGEFELKGVDGNATLVISGVSIETFEVKVGGRSDLAIVNAKTKITSMGDVQVTVNTGYQKISKERFVGSYSQLDSAAYNRRAGMSILDRLDGTVTGILIDKKSTGNAISNMQIRGLSTLNSEKAPLVIVDNFEYSFDLNNINPNDVESITILKDAAAASIWGARAGNGVIVITTKKGRFNQPLRISFNSNITIDEKPNLYYYPQMSVSDFVDLEQTLFNKGFYDSYLNNTGSRPAVSPVVELLAARKAGNISAIDSAGQMNAFKQLDVRRDLDRYAYRNAISQQHYINIGAGNDILAYNFSAGYNRSLNNVQHSKADDQFTLASNINLRLLRNLEISNDIKYSQGWSRSASFSLPSNTYPYMQLADKEGHYLAIPYLYRQSYLDTAGGGQLLDWRYRPLEEPGLVDRLDVARTIQLNLNMMYRFASWLNASVSYQYTSEAVDYWQYAGLGTYATRDMINRYTNLLQTTPGLRNPVPVGGILYVRNSKGTGQNFRGGLNLNKNFGLLHRVTALLASDISETTGGPSTSNTFYSYNKNTDTYQQSVDYTTYFPQYISNNAFRISNGSSFGSQTFRRFVSFSGNASYSYKGLYTLYGSARKDGSNIFGVNTNNKWKPLWSVGVSWDVSKEKFYQFAGMPSLRLRVTYGYAGNPGPNDVTGLPVVEYASLPSLYTNLPFGAPRGAPNPDLRWEKVNTINEGVDFSLFNNRISGNIDVWQKKSTALISTVPYAPATGILNFITNSANLKGHGFEINLQSENLRGAFSWHSSFGLSYAKTIVTKLLFHPLYKAQDFTNYFINATEGRIVYGISSYRWAGLDPLTGDPRGYYNKQITSDYNAILEDSINNQVFHGSAIPLYFGFLGNSFNWKNFSLSANITYRFDFYFRKPTINYTQLISYGNGHPDYSLRWQKPGDEKNTNIPSFVYPDNYGRDQFFQYSEINVLRGDNIRLQDIRLQYNLHVNRPTKMPFKSFQVFAYANNLNLILWRKNKSKLDPDFLGASNVLTVPTSKTYTAGILLNF